MDVKTLDHGLSPEKIREEIAGLKAIPRRKRSDGDKLLLDLYESLALGQSVLDLNATMLAAGVRGDNYFPKLAVAPVEADRCRVHRRPGGKFSFTGERVGFLKDGKDKVRSFLNMADETALAVSVVTEGKAYYDGVGHQEHLEMFGSHMGVHMATRAIASMPYIPGRVKALSKPSDYVMWEASWRPEPVRDPYLLRRLGQSPYFRVIAQWDLTEFEALITSARA